MKKIKLGIILGTRPEIIKLSPLLRLLNNQNKAEFFVIHTNQHYTKNLDQVFFDELNLPKPNFNLGVGSGDQGQQTGKMIIKIEKILKTEQPDVVVIQGDTNSVLAGALAAVKLKIKIAHVEAGLRSYDKNMPEETNRVLTDHCSDFLFCPTKLSKENLRKENIDIENIYVTGNSIVDAINQNKILAEKKSSILKTLGLKSKQYMLVTAHRAENVDNKVRLYNILLGLEKLYKIYHLPIIFPIHPRTKKTLIEFGLKTPDGLILTEPIGYLDFLQLEDGSKLIITDSGGIQEEACILHVPCITIRDTTERPETIEVGSNILVHQNPEKIAEGAKKILCQDINWSNPFGDGTSSEQILQILKEELS